MYSVSAFVNRVISKLRVSVESVNKITKAIKFGNEVVYTKVSL